MLAAEWLRRTMSERARWWLVQPDYFRFALALVAMCEVKDGAPRLVVRSDALAKQLGITRQRLRRVLDALVESGFCTVWGQRGRGGVTQIVISDGRPFGIQGTTRQLTHAIPAGYEISPGGPEPPDWGNPDIQSNVTAGGVLNILDEANCPAFPSLDLLRSPEDPPSDLPLRSGNKEDLRSCTTSAANHLADQTEEADEPLPRIASARIPERAFAAADYLRSQVLQLDRGALLGARPWSGATGLRLTWADQFRLLHRRVLAGLRNESAAATDDNAWDLVAKTVHWLFHGQPAGGPAYEVESPRSLAKKWDRIQTARRRQRVESAKAPRAADGRPDPQAEKEFSRW